MMSRDQHAQQGRAADALRAPLNHCALLSIVPSKSAYSVTSSAAEAVAVGPLLTNCLWSNVKREAER